MNARCISSGAGSCPIHPAHAYGSLYNWRGFMHQPTTTGTHVPCCNLWRFSLLANDSAVRNSQHQSLSVNEGATTTSRTHLAWSCVRDFARQAFWNAHSSPETPLVLLAVPVAVNLMLFWVPLPEKLVPLQVTLLTV